MEVRDYAQVPPLLAGLSRLIGCAAATLTHLDLRTQHEVAVFWPPSRPDTLALSAYPNLSLTHPLRRPLVAGGRALVEPLRISDVQSGLEWRAAPLHREVLRDAADQMCLPLSFRGSAMHVITLSRDRGMFTDRQRDLLAACAPHLRAALSRARYKTAPVCRLFLRWPWFHCPAPLASGPLRLSRLQAYYPLGNVRCST